MKLLSALFLLLTVAIHAQTPESRLTESFKRSRNLNINFYGPVKSAYWYYTFVADSLKRSRTPEKAQEEIMYFNRNIGGPIYAAFDNRGRITKEISRYSNFMNMFKRPLEEKYTILLGYDDKDWNSKLKLTVKNHPPYPAYSYYVVPQANYTYDDNLLSNTKTRFSYQYKTDANNRITEERFYMPDSTVINNNFLVTKSQYIYDKKGNLIRKNITPGLFGKEMPFTAMETESSYCPDLHFSYEYDQQDRLTKIILFGCEEIVQSETYTYHPTQNYIAKNEIYIGSDLRSKMFLTKTTVLHYDEYGNIIQKDHIKSYPKQSLLGFDAILPETTYYTYEYDEYHNWYTCSVYMYGKDGPLTAKIERELEYYDQN